MRTLGRWLVSLWIALSLVGCASMKTVPHPQQVENVQSLLREGDDVRLVTVYKDLYRFRVTRVGEDALFGRRGETTYEVPFPAIAKLEVRRKMASQDAGAGTCCGGPISGPSAGGEGALVIVAVVVVLSLGVYLYRVASRQVERYQQTLDDAPDPGPPGPRRVVVPAPQAPMPTPIPAPMAA